MSERQPECPQGPSTSHEGGTPVGWCPNQAEIQLRLHLKEAAACSVSADYSQVNSQ